MIKTTEGRIDVHAHYLGGSIDTLLRDVATPPGEFRLPRWSEAATLDLMDRTGTATQVLSVPFALPVRPGDPESETRFVRALNDDIADLIRRNPGRFGAFAKLPHHDVEASLDELTRTFDDLHFDGVVLSSNTRGAYLGNPSLEPLLAEIERRGVPIFLHPTEPGGAEHLAFGRPASVIEYPMDTARTLVDAIYRGAFRRHPGLRIIVAHAGGVLPALAGRINLHLEVGRGPDDDPQVTREHIADVLATNLYFETAMSGTPHTLLPLLEVAPPEHVLYGTDFGAAPENSLLENDKHLADFGGFTTDQFVAVGRANALSILPTLSTLPVLS